MSRNKQIDEEWAVLSQQLCFRDEKQMYQVMYEEEGLSVQEIADRLKCGTATLNRRMQLLKIKKRPRGGARRSADKRSLLFYLDQRLVMSLKNAYLSGMYGLSYSMVYHYKRWKAGGSFIGYNLSAQGRERGMEDVRI